MLLCDLVSNIFTTFFSGSEVCLDRCDSYNNFGYLEKNQTFYSKRILEKNKLSFYWNPGSALLHTPSLHPFLKTLNMKLTLISNLRHKCTHRLYINHHKSQLWEGGGTQNDIIFFYYYKHFVSCFMFLNMYSLKVSKKDSVVLLVFGEVVKNIKFKLTYAAKSLPVACSTLHSLYYRRLMHLPM